MTSLIKMRCLPAFPGCLILLIALHVWVRPAQAGTSPPSPELSPRQQQVPHDLDRETPGPGGFKPVAVGDYFTCEISVDWSRVDGYPLGLSDEEKKTYGIKLLGPEPGEIPVEISVYYYAEGNLMYKSVDRYVRAFSPPAPEGAITSVTVSGRAGMMFERLSTRMTIPRSNEIDRSGRSPAIYIRPGLNAKSVSVKERFVVLPAKSGFYALRYSAPTEKFQNFSHIFEKIMATFHAKR